MSEIKPIIFSRNFGRLQIPPDLDYEVRKYSKRVYGGPHRATMQARGDDLLLWELLELLRCPVFLENPLGEIVWWGFISSLDMVLINPQLKGKSRVHVGVSLDNMFNWVKIAYVDADGVSQARGNTTWASSTESANEYGAKYMLDSKGVATSTHADAARDAFLEAHKFPVVDTEKRENARESIANIELRGWWDTLDWRYYVNSGTNSVDTATQCATIMLENEFISTVHVDDLSGITIKETRDEDASALFYVQQMLETGTSNFKRLLADMDRWRNVRIYEEPSPQTNVNVLHMTADGELTGPFKQPVRKDTCPVGFWLQKPDIIPASVSIGLLKSTSLSFIDQMEYDAVKDELKPTAKEAPDPWEFPLIRAG